MRHALLPVLLLSLLGTDVAQAQAPPTIDSVEAKLAEKRRQIALKEAEDQRLADEEAKRRAAAEAKRLADAEAKRKADAEAKRKADAERLARDQAAARGTLLVQADAECTLLIDGSSQGKLAPGQAKSLPVAPGEQLIQCTSAADPQIAVDKVLQVAADSTQVVKLELAGLLLPTVGLTQPGTVFRDQLKDGNEGPEMVVIPAGSFTMGSPDSNADRAAAEGPQHRVTLESFAMGRTEVTVAQFGKFADATGYRTDAERNTDVPMFEGSEAGCYSFDGSTFGNIAGSSWKAPGFPQGGDHPVVCLSWNDVQAYVSWLAQQTGKRYRLPSEAQQEYTIRAGSNTRFAWGADVDSACTYANVVDQSLVAKFNGRPAVNCTDGSVFTHPVGKLRGNAFGLYDTVGNALEWSEDCWNESYAGAPNDGTAWTSGDCSGRVLRGAGWDDSPAHLGAGYRSWNERGDRSDATGFRLVRDL